MEKTFYRLEGHGGMGVYNSGYFNDSISELVTKMRDVHVNKRNKRFRPTPYYDFDVEQVRTFFKGYKRDDVLFGCESLEKLKFWFRGFWKPLLNFDEVKIVKYKAEKYLISESGMQVTFLRTSEGEEVPKSSVDNLK